jgi:hypothetical protein
MNSQSNRRRSERVLLQIRVHVVVEIEEGKPVRSDAFTLVVNAHGGLLEMSLKVSKGQKLRLSSPVAGLEETCTVVAVRSAPEASYTVGFEFDRPCPHFWPISFPPKDWHVVEAKN